MNLFTKIKKLFYNPKPLPQVGEKWLDKKWGDTIAEIRQISNDGERVRYKFIKINGKSMSNPSLGDMSTSFLQDYYEKIVDDDKQSSVKQSVKKSSATHKADFDKYFERYDK